MAYLLPCTIYGCNCLLVDFLPQNGLKDQKLDLLHSSNEEISLQVAATLLPYEETFLQVAAAFLHYKETFLQVAAALLHDEEASRQFAAVKLPGLETII